MSDTEVKKVKKEEDTTVIACAECGHRFGTICMLWHTQVSPLNPACKQYIHMFSD